jgi:tetratricopeptide (TPR) repeat protein
VLLGFASIALGDFPRAITHLRTSGALLEGQPVNRRLGQIGLPAVFWRAWLSTALCEIGAFPEAIAHGEDAVRIAEGAAQPYSLGLAHGALGHVYCVQGKPASGIPALARGEFLGVMWCQSRRMVQLGEAHLLADRVDDAAATAERALALADGHGERGNRAHALRLLADVLRCRDRGDFESAERLLRQALVLAEALGMRPLVARCQLGMGELYRRAGDRSKAREHLRGACAQLRALAMRLWVERAEAELAVTAT